MKSSVPFTIIYEDDHIIAVNKAAGISVGSDRWDEARERLDKLLAAHCPAQVFTVHRIDRDTSGAVVFAKDAETHKRLSAAFESRQTAKQYIAVIHGRLSLAETLCELPLVPNGDKQHRTIIDQYRGKKALTRFRLLGSAGNYSVVEALPKTGRTHQIRVHLASLGHPIVCDPLYGRAARRGQAEKGVFLSSFKKGWRGDPLKEQPLLSRLGLHALSLGLPDYTGEDASGPGLNLYAPLSRDMAALIKQMEKCGGSFSPGLF
ncbi:MAG: RluA family pseudouridine synthase [Treponema sp.]|jgi:23S rRNA pseudouridine1911/1915/1917 synthase|nr:RluA family pseudouridine synthase [Treponema sp.]